ncbi:MAG: regulatory iron-sulfur-containing complex subunit RicT [Bacteroidaceae bacterium]|nr:regulatory iron-sulfur-containing complex subunit RicT [Bacteroidaceae bacterium]
MDFKLNAAGRGLQAKGCGCGRHQLNVNDYFSDLPDNTQACNLVEVQFKNTRKDYYINENGLELHKGDMVAVESNPGHDIGMVCMTGRLVELQLKKQSMRPGEQLKHIYRIARPADMERYEEAKAREHQTMIESRQIAKNLGLEMKIGDVEFQGDGQKAIFYYIADGRVDFRQLIKDLAAAFHVRIEMKQIGARQEAGRIGGFGPCGRELCCATWMRNFQSVGTGAARTQDLSLNPLKLAGQCAKLKCCMNYEVDQYMEAARKLPSREIVLQTADADYYYFKADILQGLVTYSTDRRIAANLEAITADRAREIIAMNREGKKPLKLNESEAVVAGPVENDLAAQSDLTRFDKKKKHKKKNNRPRAENGERRDQRPRGSRREKPQANQE